MLKMGCRKGYYGGVGSLEEVYGFLRDVYGTGGGRRCSGGREVLWRDVGALEELDTREGALEGCRVSLYLLALLLLL
jgi:hypothetical protein